MQTASTEFGDGSNAEVCNRGTVATPPTDSGKKAVFSSILFGPNSREPVKIMVEVPPIFRDLNLDRIVTAIIGGKEEYDLAPFFYTRLRTQEQIRRPREITRDLQNVTLVNPVKSFSDRMRLVHALKKGQAT